MTWKNTMWNQTQRGLPQCLDTQASPGFCNPLNTLSWAWINFCYDVGSDLSVLSDRLSVTIHTPPCLPENLKSQGWLWRSYKTWNVTKIISKTLYFVVTRASLERSIDFSKHWSKVVKTWCTFCLQFQPARELQIWWRRCRKLASGVSPAVRVPTEKKPPTNALLRHLAKVSKGSQFPAMF